MKCRSFQMDDYPSVVALWREAGLDVGRSDTPEAIAHRLQRDPELFVVGEHEGSVVAAVLGCYDGRRGWINRLAVAPGHQGKSWGAAIVAELEARLRAAGCIKANLLIEHNNASVQNFYGRQGYVADPLIFMEKWL